MRHIDYLTSICDIRGLDIVDVGAGNGAFLCELQSHGARAVGIEIDAAKVAAVQDQLVGGARMIEGRAEALPFDDRTLDVACFNFSFHHVPAGLHDASLAEVLRVLKPGGRLHVVEPLPEGSMFDVVKLVEDETRVRTQSHARMKRLENEGDFKLAACKAYTLARAFKSFEDFLLRIVAVNPARSEKLPEVKNDMERAFDDFAEHQHGNFTLYQPCIAYHFLLQQH
jgi:ubiquinone/menaquinone biosynthesis C-methylase UbiE